MRLNCYTNYFTPYTRLQNNNDLKTVQPEFTGVSNVVKSSLVAAMFLIPTTGLMTSCSGDKNSQNSEYVDKKINLQDRSNYIDSISHPDYTVQAGDNLYNIAKSHKVSVLALKSLNNLNNKTDIYPNQVLKIPQTIKVKNIKSLKDVSVATGLGTEYLTELENIENPKKLKEIYYDINGNPTIGIGHKLSKDEVEKYKSKQLNEDEIYSILAQDLIDREINIKNIIKPSTYDNLPVKLREGVFDFVFHRGEGSFIENKKLIDALDNHDYSKAVANLGMNYTLVTNAKGEKVKLYRSGLCKRSLMRMGNANKIFNGKTPDIVLKAANDTYKEGLSLLKQEHDKGMYANGSYENVCKEFSKIAYELFSGKIGKPSESTTNLTKTHNGVNVTDNKSVSVLTSTPVYVSGERISKTKEEIEKDWANTAIRYQRPFKRPELSLDRNGNVSAYIKEFMPIKKGGVLANKVIIVNQGHGGCSAHSGSVENTNFDPGTSNAIMVPVMGQGGKFKRDKNGQLILNESNKFIGNGGKALEEWKVNEVFANNLIKRLTNNGAKVIFVSGEVHNAQQAIRNYQNRHKVDLLISLHSNSSEVIKTAKARNGKEYIKERITPRGFFIMPNIRNNKEDVEDFKLAQVINKNFQEDTWLKGIGSVRGASLGVLSVSNTQSSNVAGVLIETGNLKNPTDVANLNSKDFRERLVQATYEGIVEYLKGKSVK